MLKTIIATTIIGAGILACQAPVPTDIEDRRRDTDETKSSKASDEEEEDCSDEGFSPGDPESLPKCACADGGSARCVPKDDVPASFASRLEGCEGGGLCVPDSIVASGGAAPKTCTSIVGEGRCMSRCIPEVAAKGELLNRGEGDVCEEDELCVPCKNPLEGNRPTGVCEIGKKKACKRASSSSGGGGGGDDSGSCPYQGEPIDVSIFLTCGTGGRCVPEDLVPDAQRSRLAPCDGGLCAPEKSVAAAGKHLPATCRSVGGVEGRCLSTVIQDIAVKAGSLERSTCDAGELCAPCFNPLDGSDTGACRSVSCDAPKEQPRSFASCCEGRGRCVPEAQVTDPDQKDKLGTKECVEGAELCAPVEDIDRKTKRPSCTGVMKFPPGREYTGACVSSCLELGIAGIIIDQGTCDAAHKCAPCVDPLGRNTGACD